jgi:indolepyruvate ferredoxin oxidoreductase alpha subunit
MIGKDITHEEELERDVPSLIVSEGPCTLLRRVIKKYNKPLQVDSTKCIGCKTCISLGCPAISYQLVEGEMAMTADGKKRKGVSKIEATLCPGCHVCYQVCKFEAIKTQEEIAEETIYKPLKIKRFEFYYIPDFPNKRT